MLSVSLTGCERLAAVQHDLRRVDAAAIFDLSAHARLVLLLGRSPVPITSSPWTAPRRGELVGSLRGKPGLRRYLLAHEDRAAARRPRRDQAGDPPRRQVAAAHLRP